MLFWIVAALLTAAASLAVLVPLSRGRTAAAGTGANDLEVYRDQLAELERDIQRGLIEPGEAEQARAEIGRRVLRLDDGGQTGAKAEGRLARAVGGFAVLAIPLLSWGIYGLLGSPELPSQPLQARLSKLPSESSPDELVARAEGALRANPKTDAAGTRWRRSTSGWAGPMNPCSPTATRSSCWATPPNVRRGLASP